MIVSLYYDLDYARQNQYFGGNVMKTLSNLKVVIDKAKLFSSGTNDNIWLDIGKHRWKLSDLNKISSLREHEETYYLDIHPDFNEGDFSRILICKDPDKEHPDWYLQGLTIMFGEKVIYENPVINQWLEDKKISEWVAMDFSPLVPNGKSLLISEEEVKNSIDLLLNNLFISGIWNKLKMKGNSKVEVDCQSVMVSQSFEADIAGPNPKLTLWMKLVPYIHEGKVEVRIRSYEVFADYPWWFEIATLGLSNLMEIHIQGGIKKKIKENVQELIQHKITYSNMDEIVTQISLRPHKIEIL